MATEKPLCQTAQKWICGRLGRHALAPLTGQDSRALVAFVHLVALYGNSDGDGRRCALVAMASTVRAMQPSTQHLAKAVIPHVLDWSDEDPIWQRITEVA
jgi:hypothetical protein